MQLIVAEQCAVWRFKDLTIQIEGKIDEKTTAASIHCRYPKIASYEKLLIAVEPRTALNRADGGREDGDHILSSAERVLISTVCDMLYY